MPPSDLLRDAIENGVFPGAVAYCARGETVQFHGAQGALGFDPAFARRADRETIYDLASLTKLYVAAAALRCLRAHQISLDAPLRAFLPEFDARLTLSTLMNHSSGLELHLQALAERSVDDWLPTIAAAPLTSAPGTRALYLCTNYFLLGRALCAIEGASLRTIVERYVLKPADLRASFAPADLNNVAPTEADGRGSFYHGVVHDEAARAFAAQTGDCAGNAGVFADAADVAKFGQLWWSNFFHRDDIAAIDSAPLPEDNGARGLGFQMNQAFYMSEAVPDDSWGHLGFTGPSLVLHRETQSVIVLLNNRVHPTRNGRNRMPWHRELAAWCFGEISRKDSESIRSQTG